MNKISVAQSIEQAQDLTIQSIPKQEVESGLFLVNWLARAGEAAPSWWSYSRDVFLRRFWKGSDHLSGALYTMQSKMSAIPVKVVARDLADREAVELAKVYTELVNMSPGFGRGWVTEYGKFIEDLTSQDNGGFFEVIGGGPKDGAIIGPPVSIAHLDSNRCRRTGNAIYPVIYEDQSGQRFKLHYTRVMFESQMPSPISEMFGVGFCAVSRCIGVSQNLVDIVVYKQEKLGSRPHRQIIITKGGLDPHDLARAFEIAESHMDDIGLNRYSKVVVAGSQTLPEAELETHELSSMPDGFDEQTSITLGMATIALAFGMDARELFPALSAGATRADALLQHLKQRGKGPGQILLTTERMMDFKFLPPQLKFVTDFQDDAQDRQAAEIRKVRADRRVQDTATGSATERTIREQMVADGDITQEQFDLMELEDGRLPNGLPSISLLFSKDGDISKYLTFEGIDNPLDIIQNDQLEMLEMIYDNQAMVMDTLANSTSAVERYSAQKALSALNQLELEYMQNPPMQEGMPMDGDDGGGGGNVPGRPPKPGMNRVFGHQYVDPRQRRLNPAASTTSDEFNNDGAAGEE